MIKFLLYEMCIRDRPVIELAIEPKTKAGQGKLGEALAKLAEEDPTFRAHRCV